MHHVYSWTMQVARHFILNKHDAVAPKLRCCGEFPLYAGPGRLGDQRAFDLIKELKTAEKKQYISKTHITFSIFKFFLVVSELSVFRSVLVDVFVLVWRTGRFVESVKTRHWQALTGDFGRGGAAEEKGVVETDCKKMLKEPNIQDT